MPNMTLYVKRSVYTFTLPDNVRPNVIEAVKALDYTYLVLGTVTGEDGNPQRHGMIRFRNQHSERVARGKLEGCHVQINRDMSSAIMHCKKDGDFEEFGEVPKSLTADGRRKNDVAAASTAGNPAVKLIGQGNPLTAQSKMIIANVLWSFEKGIFKMNTEDGIDGITAVDMAHLATGVGKHSISMIKRKIKKSPTQSLTHSVFASAPPPRKRGRPQKTREQKIAELDPAIAPAIHAHIAAAREQCVRATHLWLRQQLQQHNGISLREKEFRRIMALLGISGDKLTQKSYAMLNQRTYY